MTHRVIEIGSPARLSVRRGQIVIARHELEDVAQPIEDIDVLLLANPQITCSNALLAELSDAKVATVICGSDYMPAGILLPYAGHTLSGHRLLSQINCSKPLASRLWQIITRGKIAQQACLLRATLGDDFGLPALVPRVFSGDPKNVEAQAAQRYWPKLLGASFRRARDGNPPNNLLNYGYAILRAATARALVGSGLQAGIGLFHSNRGDGFALASDLMEPYRPFVDSIVQKIWADTPAPDLQLTREHRVALLSVLHLSVQIDDQITPVSVALERSSATLAESLASKSPRLLLPTGMPVECEEGVVGETPTSDP